MRKQKPANPQPRPRRSTRTRTKDARRLGLRRDAVERMAKIEALILAGKYPNAVGLARELEESVSTIKRDIAFMIERLGKPIAYDAQRWGYYYTKPLDEVKSVTLSQADMLALVSWHNFMPAYQGTPLEKPMQAAFEKLTGQLDSRELYTLQNLGDALSFRTVGPEVTDLKTFEVLTGALEKRRVVTFKYRKYGQQEVRQRRVHPYHLASIDGHWYVFAHNPERGKVQTYKLSRCSEVRMESERFVRPKDFSPDKYLGRSLGVMKGDHDYEVVIEFDSYGTDLVRGRKWNGGEFKELGDGRSELRLRLSGLEEIERTVLSWGTHAKVLEPKELADRVRKSAVEVAGKYAC